MASDKTTAAPLNHTDLEELLQSWRQVGAPVATALRPGLSDDEMDASTADLGIVLPHEARVWWGWHDGAEPYGEGLSRHEICPGRPFSPLAEAVDSVRLWREIAGEAADDDDPDDLAWRDEFMVLDNSQAPIVLDCSTRGPATPTRGYETARPEVATRLNSLGAVVRLWIAAFGTGAWRWDPSRGYWDIELEKLEPFGMGDLL